MTFSPFNPIQLFRADAAPVACNQGIRNFAVSDRIMMQSFHAGGVMPELEVINGESNAVFATVGWNRYEVNETTVCSIAFVSGLPEGLYQFKCGDFVSDYFGVFPLGALRDTVLIQYARPDNRERTDIMSLFNGSILYYETRLSGGFKDSGWVFGVENEQFLTPEKDPVELMSIDYTDKQLTIGTSSGIDINAAEYVNRILSCPLLFVDGRRYTLSPEATLEDADDAGDRHSVYNVMLREAHFLHPALENSIRLNLRRTDDSVRRTNKSLRRIS